MSEELSGTRKKPFCEIPGSLADSISMGKNFNRMSHEPDNPFSIMCSVDLPHGQCSPVTDPVRIQQLAAELKPHL